FEVLSGAGRLQMRSSSPPQAGLPTVPAGGRSLAGYAAMVRRTVLVEDSESEVRFDRSSVRKPSGGGAAVATPVLGNEGVRAVVIAEWSMPRSFQQSLVHFLESMANLISVALHPTPRVRGR
ncbi:MAG: GAF domain-containing protein, partial [Candidatus Dormiibacterota bacterium]